MDYSIAKRVLDCFGAAIGLILLSPLLVVVAVLVLCFLGAPVIFTQQRVTMNCKVFRLRKFRSMRPVNPARGWCTDAERLTSFGRWLRASSLDELPSLWNVLVGDMSMVGPRPLMPDLLPLYTPRQQMRHNVRGGLSGLAQTSGRNAIPWDDKFDLDVEYVENMNFRSDLRILMNTFATVFRRDGVTKENEATTDSYGGTLRSTLVNFELIHQERKSMRWSVFASDGSEVGECGMRETDGSALSLSCDLISVAEGNGSDLLCEVLRLLVNRARGADAQYAVCRAPMDSRDLEIYYASGFQQLSTQSGDSIGLPGGERESTTLYCTLWPKPVDATDLRLTS